MSRVFIFISSLIFLFSCAPKQKEVVTPTQETTLLEQKENLQPKEELKAISLVKQGIGLF